MSSASPVAEVVARMEAIIAPLPRADGVSCFTHLYLDVTRGVERQLAGHAFADPRFLERLDVVFAGLFFDAFDAFAHAPAGAPRAWVPLFEARSRRGIAPLQFALAGMNAHINRDLPVALVTTCRDLGVKLEADSPQHADYVQVNTLLASVEAQVKQRYVSGFLRSILRRLDRIDDVVAMWDIGRARDAAWTNGEALWALRDDQRLSHDYLSTLDRLVGLAGRGLLRPAGSVLAGLTRALGLGHL